MPSPKTQPARGMRDFLPADVRKREYVIGVIKSVYERYGFEPLETPAVENIETLMGKYGEEGNQLIFKILKRGEHEKTGEADLALRYDLTVPLARVVAQYQNELPKFFKRYQIQPVWRADRPARGRFREFYQCDVDVLGSKSMVVEAELIAAASDALAGLGFNDFTIRLNHRQVLTAILQACHIDPDKHDGALVVVDKLDRIGTAATKEELIHYGIPKHRSHELIDFITQSLQALHDDITAMAGNAEALNFATAKSLADKIGGNESGLNALRQLEEILKRSKLTSANNHIKLDPRLARGLSYYTGAIFEITIPDSPDGQRGPGSLGGGGRYDNLVGNFLGRDIPACGFSLGLERIITVMTDRPEMFRGLIVDSSAQLMVGAFDEDSLSYSFDLASYLRTQGLRVLLYPEPANPGKLKVYARDQKIPFLICAGENERETGNFLLVKPKERGGQEVRKDEVAMVINRELEMETERNAPFADAIEQATDKSDN